MLTILRAKGIYKGSIGVILSPKEYDEIKGTLKIILNTNQKRDTNLRIKTGYKMTLSRKVCKLKIMGFDFLIKVEPFFQI